LKQFTSHLSKIMRVVRYLLVRALLILFLATLFVTGWMLIFEQQYIYYPSKELVHTPATVGLKYEGIILTTEDGVTLHGWFMPHPAARFTLIHFHGNAGNISHRLHLYEHWHKMGLSVFAIDYRGYGKSSGIPSEAGLYSDARAVWNTVRQRHRVPASNIIIAGRSLGCAVAAKLATEQNPAALVLENPFTNIPDMATALYPWIFPIRFLARSRFDTIDLIGRVSAPVMIISAENDMLVPATMSKRIHAAANGPKTFISLPGNHNDFDLSSSSIYSKAWQQWLAGLAEDTNATGESGKE